MGSAKKSKRNQKKDVKKKVVKKNTAVKSRKKVTSKTETAAAKQKVKVSRKLYSSTAMENAVKTITDCNKLSLRKVAQAYGVPVTTLFRKKNNPDALDTKPGPGIVLSKETEKIIVDWVTYRNQTGCFVNKDQLLDAVASYIKIMKLKTPFINDRPGRHWYEGFRKRHQNLSIKRTPRSNIAEFTKEAVAEWYCELKKYLVLKDLFNINADRVFNCDEVSVSMDLKKDHVLTTRRAYIVSTDCEAGDFNVLYTYSGMGTRAPPMIIYKNQKVQQNIIKNSPEGWGIGMLENGWMTAESFYKYICNIFYPWLVKEKVKFPVIIYVDNHSPYFSIPLVSFCREKNIEVLGLAPNNTHITQPLDTSFFEGFEESLKKTVPEWKKENNVTELEEEHYGKVVKYALENMQNEIENVIEGFQASGMAPCNPVAVNYIVMNGGNTSKQTSQNQIQDINEEENEGKNEKSNGDILRHLEASLSPDVIEKFEFSKATGVWMGDIEFKALFDYWLRLKRPSTS